MNTRRVSFVAGLVALALALHVLEAQIPTPLPWVKPGFANLMTVLALFSLGWRPALLVVLLRVIVGSLIVGSFLSPGFLLSLAGGVASAAAMAVMALGAWRLWSTLAVSAVGAVAHGTSQLLALRALNLLPSGDLPWLVPLVLVPSLIAGLCTGLLGNIVLLRWRGYLQAVG